MKYFDKNGKEILPGMRIRLDDGSVELVYQTTDSSWEEDLGISASNEAYMMRHPNVDREYYSLSNWSADCLEIVEAKMFYVYMDSPCGTELIGSSEDRKEAELIKAEQDAKWKPGFMWTTRITEKEEKEFTCFD